MSSVETFLAMKRKNFLNVAAKDYFDKLKSYKQIYNELVNQLHQNQRDQIERLFVKFRKEDYKRHYCVDLSTVISALVGEENCYKELVRYNNEKRAIVETSKILKTFNLLDSRR